MSTTTTTTSSSFTAFREPLYIPSQTSPIGPSSSLKYSPSYSRQAQPAVAPKQKLKALLQQRRQPLQSSIPDRQHALKLSRPVLGDKSNKLNTSANIKNKSNGVIKGSLKGGVVTGQPHKENKRPNLTERTTSLLPNVKTSDGIVVKGKRKEKEDEEVEDESVLLNIDADIMNDPLHCPDYFDEIMAYWKELEVIFYFI